MDPCCPLELKSHMKYGGDHGLILKDLCIHRYHSAHHLAFFFSELLNPIQSSESED